MTAFWNILALTAPLFLLIAVGYALCAWGRWPATVADALTKFVFSVVLPVLLFRLMSGFARMPPVTPGVLFAYFGGCIVVFAAGRLVALRVFRMDGVSQSVFALGGIFSNNVLLGIPMAQMTLGDAVMPAYSIVVMFNGLLLWTLCTVSVEWARNGEFSLAGLGKTARDVLANPIIFGILAGTAWGYTAIPLTGVIDRTMLLMSQAAVPLSLIALGMGLAEFGIRDGWRTSLAITALKLALMPLVVYALARALALPHGEMQAIVLMAALPVGANVYLMSRHFGTLGGPVASSLVLSTALAAATTPVILTLMADAV
jgi:malonate transporter and related proteins